MTFKDILDKFEEKRDKFEEKLEEIEEDMDEDDIPPWYGTKDDSDEVNGADEPDGATEQSNFTVEESDNEVVIEIEFPGYPRENLEADVDSGTLYITADETDRREARTYEYELTDSAVVSEIGAEYEHGVLTVTVPRE